MSYSEQHNDGIELKNLVVVLWQGKWWIIACGFIAAVLSVVIALSLPNVYRAEITAAPSDEAQGGGLSGIASQMGGLASLAGMNLGGSQVDKATIAVEVLRSRRFIGEFIDRHDIKVPLMASLEWKQSTNTLVLDTEIYDPEKQQWMRDVEPPKTPEPTQWEATKKFLNGHLFVKQDQQTGILQVAIEHHSPEKAAQWLTWLMADLNDYMRARDVSEAKASIEYLENELKTTRLTSMQEVFAQLIEQQLQTMMLANVREEYMFSTIDPAMVPEDRAKPSRALIAITGTFLGGIIGITIALIRYFWRNSGEKTHPKPGQS